jgi:hypothetical protein
MSRLLSTVRLGLLFLFAISALPESNRIGPYTVCKQHAELLKRDRLELGVRMDTANPVLAKQFRRALNFWTSVLDMRWHEEHSDACALQLTDAEPGSLDASIAAQAQDPESPDFQGSIDFNAAVTLTETEMYYYSVHEIGHLLGLDHNPNPWSVMYFEDAAGPERLDLTDLKALAAFHRLRLPLTSKSIYVETSFESSVATGRRVMKNRKLRQRLGPSTSRE